MKNRKEKIKNKLARKRSFLQTKKLATQNENLTATQNVILSVNLKVLVQRKEELIVLVKAKEANRESMERKVEELREQSQSIAKEFHENGE